MKTQPPAWIPKAREFAARVKSPHGKSFAAAKKGGKAEIYVYDAIGRDPWSETGIAPEDIVTAIAEAKGSEALDVHINSPGGLVFDGIAIFNAIRSFVGPKTVYVDGVAASIASVIAMAGDRAVMNEGSMFMIHDPMGGVFSWGTADQIEDDARKTVTALRKVRETLLDIYTNATGRSVSEISGWMTAETWMTAAESVDRGFADEVAKSPMPMEPDKDGTPERKAQACLVADLSPQARADLARARARAISEQFPRASPGQQHPGQPGATNPSRKPAAGRKDG